MARALSPSPPNVRLGRLSLRQLEWIAIVGPISFLALGYFVVLGPVHPFFHGWFGFAFLAVVLSVAVWTFSRSIFGAVRGLHTEIAKLSAETANYNQRLVSLHAANLGLMRETGVEEAFRHIVGKGAELLEACHSTLTLAGDGSAGRVIALEGESAADSRCELGRLIGSSAEAGALDVRPGPRLLAVPVAYLGSPIGTLHLARPDDAPAFNLTDEEIARMFGTHAALVVQNDRLYDEVRALAVEAERQALAHEMHDSLAQVLAFVNTKAQAVEQYLRQNDHAEARQQMAELSAAAREVLADLRQGIAALRVDMAGKSLRELVEGYGNEFADAAHLEVGLDWRIGEDEVELPPAAEVQLLRIVQEALANVRKHAGASAVELTAASVDGGLFLEVRDNGRGFDASERSEDGRPRFGLQTMRERAAAIGGKLTIDSTRGAGTAVAVRLPSRAER